MAKETEKLEESFAKLEEIIKQLEEDNLGLEDSFQLYQNGIKLLKTCNSAIDKVEKKIVVLNEKIGQEEDLKDEF